MKLIRSGTTAALALAVVCLQPARADWVVSPDLEAVKPTPGNYQVQVQNPPSFAWSRFPLAVPGYVVEVRQGTTVVYTYSTTRNWYLPTKAYPIGHYAWRVRPSNSSQWSDLREFDITSASQVFEVPSNDSLKSIVLARKRPRELPLNFVPASSWDATMKAERGPALTALQNEILLKITSLKPVADSQWPLTSSTATSAALAAQNADIRNRINTTGRQIEASALLWKLTGSRTFLNEALTRGDQLAALSPSGPTSYANQDQATRVICLSLLKGADILGADLDSTRKSHWLSVVTVRANAMYADLSGNNMRLDQYPFDSHGGTNLGFLSLIAVLGLGDISAASTWFDFAVRAYINTIYAWSGPEGGYANGTAYGQYTADYALQIWQPLSQATGVNLFNKPWSAGFLEFFTHFVPPGAVSHVFGDEQETKPDFRMMKAYASRFKSPVAAWYARNLPGSEDALSLLQAPYPLPYKLATTVTPPPNAGLYPSIGWVAMLSNVQDPLRTAIYFKSSPYGSYNHSHGDQNSIIVNSGGRQLLVEAGYLDYYGSPLFNDWYRTTKAHNAVTYDGGIGQLTSGNTANLGRNGKVTAFSTTSTLDYAEGNATAAYGSAVSSAIRRVWYLRTVNEVVVQDKLSAPLPHVWEWNLHAHAPINYASDGSVSITNIDRSVCVRPLINDSAYQIRYASRTGPAPKPGVFEAHGAFYTPSSTRGDFLMLIDVGCKKPAIKIVDGTTTRSITVGTQTISVPK